VPCSDDGQGEVSKAPLADSLLEQKRLREMLDGVLDSMPADLRAVFVLTELEGLSAREIAELLEVPPGTVASRLRRAREAFTQATASLKRGSPDFGGSP
jgi:RNA polymerase sigma-70 factor (ECF subfamily)